MNKNDIREKYLKLRKNIDDEYCVNSSNIIIKKVLKFIRENNIKNIMCYKSFNKEVSTDIIINELIKDNHNIYIPYITDMKYFVMEGVQVKKNTKYIKGAYDILVPKVIEEYIDPKDLELIIVPGVAFDNKFNRVGFGKGYYDKYMSRLIRKCIKMGVFYDFQKANSIPSSKYDIKFDIIFTEKQTKFRGGSIGK